MSNVNEFNVSTQQYTLREYTQDEINQLQEDSQLIPCISVNLDLTVTEQKQHIYQSLINLGFSEEQASTIAGV